MLEMNPEIPKDPEKIDRIMASATKIFANNGYLQAKTADIAKDADVSKGIVFRYFGDKGHLYLATVTYVIDLLTKRADFTVWTDAKDLGDMIERAVRYKIELQLQYPDEFKLSVQSFGEMNVLPEDIRPQISELWQKQTTTSIAMLEEPVLDRMKLRPGVDKTILKKLLGSIGNSVFVEAEAFMKKHPDAKIEDFEPIINEIQAEYEILEHGFATK
ncbi:TetR/AcrR family transcriptional regulator [Lactobacillus sp. LC28-10]|uniref:TetR/AcrR family transcriptional regulator n=1 Tax=Secundilactobacillus angelensis TaxID=2722706 RepID=A0ABX1KX47_9LACO|nr:TetR/AcrR family transcriptional regulator [Secundilactobacillus angelensis]MCH5461921.1 TetR/AcrR family transcriptional regulator [Secundilactobacillus angelensis]NLR17408.1 TetR/AcrR family transcriptional regulator [Secundilactobacillus angelensis]